MLVTGEPWLLTWCAAVGGQKGHSLACIRCAPRECRYLAMVHCEALVAASGEVALLLQSSVLSVAHILCNDIRLHTVSKVGRVESESLEEIGASGVGGLNGSPGAFAAVDLWRLLD